MTIERKTNSDQTMADNRLIKNKPKTEKPKSTSSDKGNKSRSLNVESSRGDSSLTDRGGDEDVEIIEREIEEITVSDSEEPQPSTRKHASFLTEPKTIEILTMSDLEKDHEKDDTTDMYSTETFNEYKPRKVKFTHAHPSSVVEKVSLASVEPVDVTYELSLPQNVIDEGLLSAVQLEAVVYASQAHEIYLPDKSRAGFFIGDGAGVGKGRTVAGIIYENYQKGRKCALWFSVSGDLKVDAERDLRDIGASCIKIHNTAKMKYDDDISSAVNGNVTEGVIFCTYSTLVGSIKKPNKKYTSRLNQLIQCCGVDFDGVIIFDDFYKALDSYWSKEAHLTSIYVQKMQEKLPHARVVYASAAGASDPRHMAYMSRLGLWGTGTLFPDIGDFLKAVERRGESAMELVAMDMKQRGVYIARQLSFQGVNIAIKEVPMSDEFKKVYDDSTELWADARLRFVTAIGRKFDEKKSNSIWKQFWSAHKKFFRYLGISAKTEAAAQEARRAVAEGKCVVIGLQTTGEARTHQLLSTNQHMTHFVSIAKDTFMKLVEKHFPTNPDEKDAGHQPGDKRKLTPESSAVEAKRPRVCPHTGLEYRFRPPCDCREQELLQQKIDLEKKSTKELKEELLAAIEKLDLPPDPIDELIWRLGGPDQVAEMTGRVMRGVKGADGGVRYEARAGGQGTKKAVNLAEKDLFMDGVKTIAIISDAASSQISLHSDRRVKNQKQRVHITLQLPWSADQAVQQFGRTHRSNQVNAPEYIFLISDLAGERRFASTVAKRLESLGALTHGDRQATDSRDIRQFDIYNKYGRLALDMTMRAIYEMDPPEQMLVYTSTRKDFTLALEQVQFCDEKDFRDMTMFLKRILGIPVKLQNELFALFTDTFEAVVQLATVKGTLSLGVLEVYPRTRDNIQYVGCESFPCSHATGTASVKLHTLLYQPCMDWTNAEKIYLENRGPSINGFYKPKTNYRPQEDTQTDIMLCISEPAIGLKNGYDVWTRVYRPSTGRKPELKKFYLATFGVTKMWKTVKTKRVWETLYEASIVSCNHQQCDFKCLDGKNARIFYILSGSVLSVWKRVERVLFSGVQQKKSSVMKVVHLNTSNNEIVGIFIPARNISMLRELLAKDPTEFPKIENNQLIKKETNKDTVKIKDEPKEIETYMDLDAKLMYKPKKLDISDPWTKDLFKDFDNFYEFNDTQFFDKYRISKKAVLELWNMFDDIFKYRIFKGKMIKELAICLRYFATGVNYEKLAETCKVSKQFVARSIDTFTTHVLEHFPYYDCTKMPKTNEDIQKYKDEFFQIAHFPNVIGCIDHIHVNVTDTLNCGRSRLYNTSRRRYEKESTLHFLLVSDANTKVINVDTCSIQDFVKGNSYYNNMARSYVKGPTSYLLGDSKFPLSKIIMTPVENPTTKQQQNYNNSHSKTMANTVKSLIYQLKCRFPPLALGIDGSRHNMTVDVFKACCLIHNLCIDMGEPVPKSSSSLSEKLSKEQSDSTYSGEKGNTGSFTMKEERERIIREYFDGI